METTCTRTNADAEWGRGAMTNHEQLRALATEAKGWGVNIVKPATDDDSCQVGRLGEDGEFYPLITIDCENYFGDSKHLAEFIVAASPDVVLALLADLERKDALLRDAARYRWLRTNCISDVQESMNGPGHKQLMFIGKIYPDWRFAIDHIGLDAAIDAAMKEQA